MTGLPIASEQPTLTVAELAELLGCHDDTLRDAIRAGQVPGVIHLGRRTMLATAVVRRWLEVDAPDPRAAAAAEAV